MIKLSERVFRELTQAQWDRGNLLCVGLDSDWAKVKNLPSDRVGSDKLTYFNYGILDAVSDSVGFVKPNLAFYEGYSYGSTNNIEAMRVLETTLYKLRNQHPDIVVIGDGKRGDIDNTNSGYVKALYDDFGFDAVTLHGYMGGESLAPFIDRPDKGVLILCKTSNKGAGEFQDLEVFRTIEELGSLFGDPTVRQQVGLNYVTGVDLYRWVEEYWAPELGWKAQNSSMGYTLPLYQMVAASVSRVWNRHGNCGLVVGATYPEDLKKVRTIVGEGFPILAPGVGAQGAEVSDLIQNGADSKGQGLIINASRSVIFADNPGAEARKLAAEIRQYTTQEVSH